MLEQDLGLRTRESWVATSEFNPPVPDMIRGTVYAFSNEVKEQARRRAGGKCEMCHNPGILQVHHMVSQVAGGTDNLDNAVVLDRDCHLYWDNRTLRDGVMYPGIPLANAPEELIHDRHKFQKVLKQQSGPQYRSR